MHATADTFECDHLNQALTLHENGISIHRKRAYHARRCAEACVPDLKTEIELYKCAND